MAVIDYLSLVNAMYEERVRGKRSEFVDENGNVVAILCTYCEFRHVSDFWNPDDNRCKSCMTKRSREYQKSEKWKDYQKNYVTENADRIREYHRRNPHIAKAAVHRRYARKKQLPNDFSTEDLRELLAHFGGGCALTGSTDYHLDHVIPLATGHGGTIRGNMIPLRSDLNVKKNAKNIFEWFNECKKREGLSQERFDALIEYLAELNGMTPQEYRDYVYECHAEEATTWMDTEKQFNTTQTTS